MRQTTTLAAIALLAAGCSQSLSSAEGALPSAPKEQRAQDAGAPDADQDRWDLPLCPGRSAASPPTPRGSGGAPGLSREQIRRGVRRHINALRSCAERYQTCEDMGGRWLLRFIVSPEGVVSHAAVVDFSPYGTEARTNPEIEECYLRTFCGIRFDPPGNGREVLVTYPIHFDGVCGG